MPALRLHVLVLLLAAGGIAGCSSARQIQTAPPQPANQPAAQPDEETAGAGLAIFFETGDTALPEEVQALRFRVAELHLKERGGDWTPYPADVNSFEIRRNAPALRKAILATHLPPAQYDSLAVSLSNVYVEYGPNAGGPLTTLDDEPVRLALSLRPELNRTSTVRLVLEPGASLSRDERCRWFFLPVIVPTVEAQIVRQR